MIAVAMGNGDGFGQWPWVVVVAVGNGGGLGQWKWLWVCAIGVCHPWQGCPVSSRDCRGGVSEGLDLCSVAILVATSFLLLAPAQGALWRPSEGENDTGEEVAGIEGGGFPGQADQAVCDNCEKQGFCELLSKMREFFDVVSMVLENVQLINRLVIVLYT